MGKDKKKPIKQQIPDDEESSQEEIETSVKPIKSAKEKVKAKNMASVNSDDEDIDVDKLKNNPKKKSAKKNSKTIEEDSDEISDSDQLQPSKDAKKTMGGKSEENSQKTKGKSKGKKAIEDNDESDGEVAQIAAPVSAFALLAVDSGNDDEEEEEIVVEKQSKNKKGKKNKNEEVEKVEEPTGKKAKRKGKKKDDDEDIDKMLAELELEYSGKKVDKPVEVIPNEPVKEGKKKKNRKNKDEEEDEADVPEPVEEIEIEPVVESKVAEKKKKKKKDVEVSQPPVVEEVPAEEVPEEIETKQEEDEDQAADKKKKKKKKKGKEEKAEDEAAAEPADKEGDDKKKKGKKKLEEANKKDKKGPGNKAIAAIREALLKQKEEEERLKREEEEAERRAIEEERIRQEQLRLEQEKRELKKQREREKKEKLKAEGKFLTAKQRAQQARTQQSLEALRAQGIDVPVIGEKRPRPGTRVRPSKQQRDQMQKMGGSEEKSEEDKMNENNGESKEGAAAQQKEEVEEVKESWDAESSSSEEEVEEVVVPAAAPVAEKPSAKSVATKKAPAAEETSSDDSDESDDDDSEDDSDNSDSEEDEDDVKKSDAAIRREKALDRIQKRRENAEKNRSLDVLRAPVVCVLGHVDTGKTKILDKLRRTNVQDGEAGGITQQIGATNVPIDAIREASKMVASFTQMELKIPGLLIIDTPGHESFSNLRSRGSSLCDIAILVVDIMHGLEPQTLESINLLKTKKTPFVVALNKIDRLYDWVTNPRKDVRDLIKMQERNTQQEFQDRVKSVVVQFAEQSLNAALFYENPDPRSYISMVPTSAATGDGMGNLMALIVELTQTALSKRLMYSEELHATVLEVKAIPGYGTTIDVILVNGSLREGDTVVLAGTDGPIVTQIRSLLLPQPMKELRVKNSYTENKVVKAAQGVKVTAKDLEKAIAGLHLLVANHPDEVEICEEEVADELKSVLGCIKLKERGVYVQASTLGSLEALLEFLKTSEIPYSNIRIGPVVKKDVMRASVMLEHDAQYAVILAFDVRIERDAQEMADNIGVKIFQADIIYHLFDRFIAYRDELKRKKREEFKHIAVFPCKLKILPQYVFNSRDPIVVGVMVENGIVKEGTPLCVPGKEFVEIGIVTTIEINHKPVESARKGQEICIKISATPGQAPKMVGRHFEVKDMLVSKISRESIDACKEYFRDDLQKSDWQLMIELKKLFQIL